LARAKQTGRAEARRRYRQAQVEPAAEDAAELDFGERRPDLATAKGQPQRPASPYASGRLGFGAAFRGAYHRADIRDDLRHLPMLLRSRAFLGAVLMILAGAAGVFLFPGMTGSAFAWELLVWPGSALAPQLVAGFFAPRASYILGFLVGLIQGVVFTVFLTQFASRLGTSLPPDQVNNLLSVSFLTGPITGALFAAASAWYRRFLSLSSPRRAPAGRPQGNRSSKASPSRRPAGR
jgi:hypothetical protein